MHKKILFSVGDLSGDEHGAALVSSLKSLGPELEIKGMGGSSMRAAGMETIVDSDVAAGLMGFQEVLANAGKVIDTWRTMKNALTAWRPDLLILIDYPDFNLRLAKAAKKLGIRVFYFITPQVWAWRSSRIKTIEAVVDQAAVIFPFERPFFEKHGFKRAVFVGHPFVGKLSEETDIKRKDAARAAFLSDLGLDPACKALAVLPGSRRNEIFRHLPILMPALQALKEKHSEVEFVMPLVPSVKEMVERVLESSRLGVKLVDGNSLDVLRNCDAGLLKSGTSNLQAAFLGLPFSMYFKTSALTAFIAGNLLKIKSVSIVNIVRENTIREMLQKGATTEALGSEAERLLYDSEYRNSLRAKVREAAARLADYDRLGVFEGCRNATERAAKLAFSML